MRRNALLLNSGKALMTIIGLCFSMSSLHAEGIKATYTVNVERTMDQTDASVCPVYKVPLQGVLGVDNVSLGSNVTIASVHASGKVYSEFKVSPNGNYFNADLSICWIFLIKFFYIVAFI